jgi:hypothetical protein
MGFVISPSLVLSFQGMKTNEELALFFSKAYYLMSDTV